MDRVLDGRLLNAEPSPPDPNDVPFLGNTARGLPPRAGSEAPSFRHTGKDWPILDQHASGTCGGQAGIGLRQWQELREKHAIDKFSAFELYDRCLEADGTPDPNHDREAGTFAKTVMTVLKEQGTPLTGGGLRGKIKSFEKLVVLNKTNVKEAIFDNGPVLVRLDWDVAWAESKLLKGRILPKPTEEDGGHIFLLFGWDDGVNGGSFLMRNSWGNWDPKVPTSITTTKKAGRGNAYMKYAFFLDPARRAEVWVSVDVLRGP
jgi:hypothetical protein